MTRELMRESLACLYVERALNGECEAVARMAPNSGRNLHLFQAAANLGELCGAGLLPEKVAEDALEGVALYLTCEDDQDELQRRQDAICEALSLSLAELSGKLHLVTLMGQVGNELATFDPQNVMATTPTWERLKATVQAIQPGFIALDNVAHLFAGNENIRAHVAAFCNLMNSLAAEAGAAVLFIGHPNKAGQQFSGSTASENQVRSRLFLD